MPVVIVKDWYESGGVKMVELPILSKTLRINLF